MADDKISDATRELPEVRLQVTVYFHCDTRDEDELDRRTFAIQRAIEAGLIDEDNGVDAFTYPEVKIGGNG